MPRPLLIFSQSDYLIQVADRNSDSNWQTVQIQICWLLKNPTNLDLHCLQRQDKSSSAGLGLSILGFLGSFTINSGHGSENVNGLCSHINTVLYKTLFLTKKYLYFPWVPLSLTQNNNEHVMKLKFRTRIPLWQCSVSCKEMQINIWETEVQHQKTYNWT